MAGKKYHRLLLTGAAGALGTQLRPLLPDYAEKIRLNDRDAVKDCQSHEESISADLGDMEAMLALTKDVDAVVHMGGQSREGAWADVLNSNIVGMYNLYEGCRKNGVKRVIWASSVHTIGFYPRTEIVNPQSPTRPDSNYGTSKVYGEAVAQYYWDKYGIESVSVRIYSCFPEPLDRRQLTTWLSYNDLRHLIGQCLWAPSVRHTIIYGVSNNPAVLIDNRLAAHIGYHPQDSSEIYRAKVEANSPEPDPKSDVLGRHGGQFTVDQHFDD